VNGREVIAGFAIEEAVCGEAVDEVIALEAGLALLRGARPVEQSALRRFAAI
jgi:hypothetical protein